LGFMGGMRPGMPSGSSGGGVLGLRSVMQPDRPPGQPLGPDRGLPHFQQPTPQLEAAWGAGDAPLLPLQGVMGDGKVGDEWSVQGDGTGGGVGGGVGGHAGSGPSLRSALQPGGFVGHAVRPPVLQGAGATGGSPLDAAGNAASDTGEQAVDMLYVVA
jgi:hypothetical protein